MTTHILHVRQKGHLTLPADFRARHGVEEGDIFTVIDMGDGTFLLTPRISEVNRLGERVAVMLNAEGVSLDDLLNTLNDERER